MIFQIELSSGRPVYQQLADQVKFAIASGRLRPGDRLPTVRDVAVQVRVNRNTIARVYSELEREGILYTRAGQGTFVNDGPSRLHSDEQRRQLEQSVDDFLTSAKLFGLSEADVLQLLHDRLTAVYPAYEKPKGASR